MIYLATQLRQWQHHTVSLTTAARYDLESALPDELLLYVVDLEIVLLIVRLHTITRERAEGKVWGRAEGTFAPGHRTALPEIFYD